MEPVWLRELGAELLRRESEGLLRGLRVVEQHGRTLLRDGRELVNLASNDYLGLSTHPRLAEAAVAAVRSAGCGAGASRLVGGHTPEHRKIEEAFARFKHAEAAMLCPTGYMANLAALAGLAGKGDLICLDKLCHASLLDAARASGGAVRVYPHLQTDKLRRLLVRASGVRRKFIVTDSVFSMDGDVADLPMLCDLAREHEAILMIDEAHATGVLGASGSGLAELQGVAGRVDVVVSTASKALGGLGGIVTGRRVVIDTLINRARAFIYTTAVPPAQAAAIGAALEVVRDEPWRRARVIELAGALRSRLAGIAWLSPAGLPAISGGVATPIIPLVVGSASAALALGAHLEEHGFFAPAIRPPTVAPGSARVRISLRADLLDDDLERLLAALRTWR